MRVRTPTFLFWEDTLQLITPLKGTRVQNRAGKKFGEGIGSAQFHLQPDPTRSSEG